MKRAWWLGLLLVGCGGAAAKPARPTSNISASTMAHDVAPPAASEDEGPIPIAGDDPTWGSRTAPVTVVEFADFQCPYCSRVEGTLDELKRLYGPNKLRIVWKNNPLPFHPSARLLAEMSQGVFALGGPDAFWTFHHATMSGMARSSEEEVGDEQLRAFVGNTVDRARLVDGLTKRTWSAKVDRDMKLAGSLGAHGTPSFFVNGTLISGAQSVRTFRDVIDGEAQKASAKLESGVPAERIHLTMAAENRANAPVEEPDKEEDPSKITTIHRLSLGKTVIATGPADALVTLVEFGDFDCPFTRKVEPVVQKLRAQYPKDLRLVWKHHPLPFHGQAANASQLAMQARDKGGEKSFWTAHDKLLAGTGPLAETSLDALARELGVVRNAKDANKYALVFQADEELADDFEVSGTPTFFINGRRIVGAHEEDTFVKVIEQELTRARAEVAKGVKPPKLYEALIKDGKGPQEPEKKSVEAAPTAPSTGNAKATVTITEFSDFQCPYCQRADETMTKVMHDYDGRVRRVFRHLPLPFHSHAHLAAEAAMEAYKQKGADGFFKMHDLLFANQKDGLERAALDRYAGQLGLDMKRFGDALDGGAHKAEVDADAQAAQKADIHGTPAFLINGYYVSGAQPYRKFKRIIDRALSEASHPVRSAR
jgi:protein-disulfide isomerase